MLYSFASCYILTYAPNSLLFNFFPVDWQSFQTELSVDADGKWKRSQHRIHPIFLCEFDSFHSFLLHALKLRGKSDLVFIRFFLYARYFGTEVKDQLIAEVHSPPD